MELYAFPKIQQSLKMQKEAMAAPVDRSGPEE
jgi:hypothetical protein